MSKDEKSSGSLYAPRRQNRIFAIQVLFMNEVLQDEITQTIRNFFEDKDIHEPQYAFSKELILGSWQYRKEADKLIEKYAKNWSLSRIARIDLSILRLAVYELNNRLDIPPIVIIDEAIELAKLFSSEDASKFINGLLNKIKEGIKRPLRDAVDT